MDARHLVHFVNATKSVFSMMLQLPVACAMPQRTDDLPARTTDVSGIIGLSGDAVGCVVLAFPRESAVKVIERFVGSPLDPLSDDFADAVGELVNMISGSAKAQIEGHDIRISVPSVVVGDNHKVQTMSDATCVRIPCNSELGPFSIEVALKFGETAGVTDAAAGESRAA
jgi:chemotaxis protein CheX